MKLAVFTSCRVNQMSMLILALLVMSAGLGFGKPQALRRSSSFAGQAKPSITVALAEGNSYTLTVEEGNAVVQDNTIYVFPGGTYKFEYKGNTVSTDWNVTPSGKQTVTKTIAAADLGKIITIGSLTFENP